MIKKLIKNVIYAIIFVCIIGALCIFSTTFVSQRVDVNGNSMNPTLFNNDSLWLNKLTYHFQNPKRFDIVVIDTDLNGGEYIIKRIIGLPGDTIQIKNQKVKMIQATCPDHLCIKQGTIDKKGSTIVCLPHHLIIEIKEGKEEVQDGKVY